MNHNSSTYDVIILGAGAAGLFCALTAAQRGRRVLVLEKANKVGKKILMSGGGRCNFSNYFVTADNYISNNPHFAKSALSRYSQWDFIAMVEKHGIDYEERKHGQLFCLHSANDILAMLLDECEQAGAEIKTHCHIDSVRVREGKTTGYQVDLTRSDLNQGSDQLSLHCTSLVVATGALSIPTLGGSGLGYELASQFGLTLTSRRAGLVPFMFSDKLKPVCERLSGLALEVEVRCKQRAFSENMLFTHRGISGPVMLQISNYWQPGDEIIINLLPGTDASDWLLTAKQQQGKTALKTLLAKKLAKSLVAELLLLWSEHLSESKQKHLLESKQELPQTPLAECTDKQLTVIGEQLNHWCLKPSATEGYRTAEVTLGGVDTGGISSKTMEAKQQSGLYFVGEVLDVSGHLGGYNFQWAWSSGYSAGLFV
jgi:predicted Rossmann fold flavoprotein